VRAFLAPPAPPSLEPGSAPTFSILIAAYNAAGSIVECVQSALHQTAPAHEVIVVDDGSTDQTGEQLAPYRGRIVYVHQDNRGAAAASNLGARKATGDFVSILDADDVYEPQRLEALTELAIARPDLDILMTDAKLEVEGEIVGRFYEKTPFEIDRQQLAIFERCFVAWPAVRRTRFLELGGFDESMRIGYDWECWIRMLHAGCRAGGIDEPLLRYRIAGHQSLTDDRVAALQSRVRVLEVAAQLDLAADERAELDRYLRRRRRRVLLAESEQALRARRPDARRRSFVVAFAREMPLGARLRALAAAAAPRTAARRLAALEARTGQSRIKRTVPRKTEP
jgi:hypothetical protein